MSLIAQRTRDSVAASMAAAAAACTATTACQYTASLPVAVGQKDKPALLVPFKTGCVRPAKFTETRT